VFGVNDYTHTLPDGRKQHTHDPETVVTCTVTDKTNQTAAETFPIRLYRGVDFEGSTHGVPEIIRLFLGVDTWPDIASVVPMKISKEGNHVIVRAGEVAADFIPTGSDISVKYFNSTLDSSDVDASAINETTQLIDPFNPISTAFRSIEATCDGMPIGDESKNCNKVNVKIVRAISGSAETISLHYTFEAAIAKLTVIQSGPVPNHVFVFKHEVMLPSTATKILVDPIYYSQSIPAASYPFSVTIPTEGTFTTIMDELNMFVWELDTRGTNVDHVIRQDGSSSPVIDSYTYFASDPQTMIAIDPSISTYTTGIPSYNAKMVDPDTGDIAQNGSPNPLRMGEKDGSCGVGSGDCIERGIAKWKIKGASDTIGNNPITEIRLKYSTVAGAGSPLLAKIGVVNTDPDPTTNPGVSASELFSSSSCSTCFSTNWDIPLGGTTSTQIFKLGDNKTSTSDSEQVIIDFNAARHRASPTTWCADGTNCWFAAGISLDDGTVGTTSDMYRQIRSIQSGSTYPRPQLAVDYCTGVWNPTTAVCS
jgi:hypothetical protein